MQATATANLLRCFSPLRLAGPIFDKELRVASRRRRLYLLRFAYVAVLTLSVVQLWYTVLPSGGGASSAVRISRLGEMGKGIVAMVVWFQFITGQILAAVLLSDAIGSEVRQRTLDVLLVTPVRSFQIVIGKLLSKLLQLVSLLAISLPMLAVVRVFGGVPWDYVAAGLCITLSAGVFAGALSLFSSITSRPPYHAILTVVLWDVVIWGLLAMLLGGLSASGYVSTASILNFLRLTNPFVAAGELTQRMLSGSSGAGASPSWPWLCLVLLGSAGSLLAWSVRRVRRIALATASGRVREGAEEAASRTRKLWGRAGIRPVVGSPIAWKERCTPLFKATRRGVSVVAFLLAALFLFAVVLLIVLRGPAYVLVFPIVQALQLIFVLDVAVAAASAITREREARTWPILLMTPLDAREIIRGKALGVFRRNLPLLLPLPVLYLLMLACGPPDPEILLPWVVGAGLVIISLASTTFFLLGTGLYFSARLKTTTAAVAATLAVYVVPKFLCCGFLSPLFFVSIGMLGVMAGPSGGGLSVPMLALAIAPAGIYAGVGLLFMRLAVGRVRRDVF